MPKVIVQATVADYAKWRAVFDQNKPLRVAATATKESVYRSVDDGNAVIACVEVSDLAKARQVLATPEMRASMQASGIIGAPNIHLIE